MWRRPRPVAEASGPGRRSAWRLQLHGDRSATRPILSRHRVEVTGQAMAREPVGRHPKARYRLNAPSTRQARLARRRKASTIFALLVELAVKRRLARVASVSVL